MAETLARLQPPEDTTEDAMGAVGTRIAELLPKESRNALNSFLGSGGRGGMFIMQTLGIFSSACCNMVTRLNKVK